MANNKIRNGVGRRCARSVEWSKSIRERDKKCLHCGTKENLHAHHIVSWKDDVNKRFDLENGITLCKSCHKKEDGCVVAGWNKGLTRSETWRKNLSNALKGRPSWNKGIKGIHFSPETEFKKGHIPWNKGNFYENPKERICKICNVQKEIMRFVPQQRGKYYSHICKNCRNERLRG